MKIESSNIVKPTLILDKKRVLENIEKMAAKARRNGVRFRPHFKTHQSARVGEWYRQFDVNAITVSSVSMAAYFAENGWDDITIAFPVNVREITEINRLANQINLNLLVESKETVQFLGDHLQTGVNVWIKIDVGTGRTGILASNHEAVVKLADEIANSTYLSFKGLLAHAGHTYDAKSKDDVVNSTIQSILAMNQVRNELKEKFDNVEISIGDTPGCSIIDDFGDVDEIRPGNFVFYDVMQLGIGSCLEENIAIALACPVVAKHADRNEIILYCGAVHLSKDYIFDNENKIFGRICTPNEKGWGQIVANTTVAGLSQEHGTVKTDSHFFNQINIGDTLYVLPVHSCLTANLLGGYTTLEGERISMGRFFP